MNIGVSGFFLLFMVAPRNRNVDRLESELTLLLFPVIPLRSKIRFYCFTFKKSTKTGGILHLMLEVVYTFYGRLD